MSSRTRARRRALEILFEAEARTQPPLDLLEERSHDPEYPMKPYAREIVEGVVSHAEEIDELISTWAQGWAIDRMPGVDRALVRVGVWEILHNDEVSDVVVINECTDLAASYSTDDSPKFVNGFLDKIREIKPTLS